MFVSFKNLLVRFHDQYSIFLASIMSGMDVAIGSRIVPGYHTNILSRSQSHPASSSHNGDMDMPAMFVFIFIPI